jgi:hypothetical protein
MDNDKIIRILSKKYGKDERVIRSVTNVPFLFTKKVISSLEDERPIRIPYMGSFVLRRHRTKSKHLHYMLLKEVVERLKLDYEKSTEERRKEIVYTISVIIDVLIDRGYKDEQFVQHLIEWQNRA